MKKVSILVLVLGMLLIVFSCSAFTQVVLRIAIHTDFNREGFDEYLEEYTKLHPDIEFEKIAVPFEDYLTKVSISHISGDSPDIYHVYSLWGVDLVKSNILDLPPQDIRNDVYENYERVAVDGVTINNEIWGIPTEIDNYCLVYNKKILADSGFLEPPKTWDELINVAKKCTKSDKAGNIIQYGFVFLAGWESAVVHPYLSLAYSNGARFLNEDKTKCIINSPEGIEALEAEVKLFKERITDISGSVWDFPNGNIAMMIMAPWDEGNLKGTMGDDYQYVGVAPIPVMKNPATLLYTWFACVDSKSKHKKEAWDFLRWLTGQIQPDKRTTRMGDYLVEKIGAIPSRKIDIDNHYDELFDQYTKTFVQELKHSIAEDNIYQGAEIKITLMNEITNAWLGEKTSKQALDDAVKAINAILSKD